MRHSVVALADKKQLTLTLILHIPKSVFHTVMTVDQVSDCRPLYFIHGAMDGEHSPFAPFLRSTAVANKNH
jgi:hypothetical protein